MRIIFCCIISPSIMRANRKLRGVEALIPLEGWQRQNDQSGKIHSHCGEERNDHSYRQLGTGTEYPYFFRMEEPLRSSFCAVSEYFRVQYQKEDFVETLLNIIHKYDVDPDEIELRSQKAF